MSPLPVYVPIIKGKVNDLCAFGALAPRLRDEVKPLIEAMPINPKKPNVDEHVHKLCNYIRKHAPLGQAFVDFYGLMPDAVTPDGTNATLYGYGLLKAFGRAVTPVYGLDRNDELWPDLGKVAQGFQRGFAFRLRRDDLAEYLFDDTWAQVVGRSSQMRLRASDIDLILDFGSMVGTEIAEISEIVSTFLFSNPRIRDYRSVVIVASSALKTVGEVERDNMTEVVRNELHLWAALWRDMPDDIKPIFGDYGVVHPDFSDFGPNKNINAKIRYTVGDRILYYRGHGLNHPVKDYDQYHGLARAARADRRFQGRGFSFGDSRVDDCASGLIGPGSTGMWVKADMNHHLSYTTLQVNRLIPVLNAEVSGLEISRLLETI